MECEVGDELGYSSVWARMVILLSPFSMWVVFQSASVKVMPVVCPVVLMMVLIGSRGSRSFVVPG